MDDKPYLRAAAKAVRAGLSEADRVAGSAAIGRHLLADARVRDAGTVYLYMSFGAEVGTRGLAAALAAGGAEIIAPAPERASDPLRDAVRVTAGAGYSDGEPSSLAIGLLNGFDIQRVDLFLVPGLAFDRHGHRLGYGGGFFDRLLAAARPDGLAIGLAFDLQLAAPLPAEAWDVPLGAIVTPARGIMRVPCDTAAFYGM